MRSRPTWHRSGVLAFAAAALHVSGAARAQAPPPADLVPRALERVGVEQKLDARLPLAAVFRNESGREVELREFFDGRRPVLLTLNYYECPGLCTVQLNDVAAMLREMKWTAGEQFRMLTVSFDHHDSPKLAKAKRDNYLAEYARRGAEWNFLVGRLQSVRELTEAVGFSFQWNEKEQEWAHSAVLIVLTPDGRVSRYFGDLGYDAETVRLSLVEASQGKVGSLTDRLFLWCYHYDLGSGSYVPVAWNLMRLGGVATVIVLGLALAAFWVREARRRAAWRRDPAQRLASKVMADC